MCRLVSAFLVLTLSNPVLAGPMMDAYENRQKAYFEYHQKLKTLPADSTPKDKRALFQKTVAPTITQNAQAFDRLEKNAILEFKKEFAKEKFKSLKDPILKTWSESPEKLPKDFSIVNFFLSKLKKNSQPNGSKSPSPTAIPFAPQKRSYTPSDSGTPPTGPVLSGEGLDSEIYFERKAPVTPLPSQGRRQAPKTSGREPK